MVVIGTTPSSPAASDVSFDHLYSAIIQCFVIILSGYVAGRGRLISPIQGDGIGTFVSKFCLPALLFKSMCELNFSQVNWMFLVGILISKASLFLIVGLVTLIVKRPLNLGHAGLFAIFATQSNDFALGYPIVHALYGGTHPDYLKYLYLIAPISLVFLNPIGFTLMEINKHRSVHHSKETDDESSTGLKAAVGHVLKGVLLNPIVFMTAVGVAGNFIFGGKLPGVLDDILTVLGQAFNASALFYLGLSMVGKVQSQLGIGLIVPILLITAKTILLPLISWEVIGWLVSGNQTTSLSMYGFLYGTFPTAPSVFLYSSSYGIGQDVIASGLVLGTFLSAPLMFVSAKMMTVVVVSGADYRNLLTTTSFNVSIISMTCCIWVICVFFLSGKGRRIPHRFTMAFMFSNILACAGMITFYVQGEDSTWHHYPVLICLLAGVFSMRCWTATMAVIFCLLHVRSLCFVLRKQVWFYFSGFGVPVIMTGLVFMIGAHEVVGEIDPSFHYGTVQTICSLVVLVASIVVTIVSLVWWQRVERHSASQLRESFKYQRQESVASCRAARPSIADFDQGADGGDRPRRNLGGRTRSMSGRESPSGSQPDVQSHQAQVKKSTSIEDLVPYGSPSTSAGAGAYAVFESGPADIMENVSERTCLLGQCTTEQRHACMDKLRTYTANVLVSGEGPQELEDRSVKEMNKEEYQTAHHLILLLLLLLSMFVGMFLCTWRVFHRQPTGIYVEIEFLDCVFNYGQGLLVLIVFGFDTRLVFSPVLRRLRRLIYGVEIVRLPKLNDLDETTKQTCRQFTDYHKDNCKKEIVRDRRFKYRTFESVFTGTSLCDWLVRAGLASDREAAVTYGRHLLMGRVITHLTSEHNFHDAPYFYKFLDTFDYMAC